MRYKIPIFLGLWGCLWLSACIGPQVQPGAGPWERSASLDKWTKETLIPYLVQQLKHHPRFKGQAVLLVRMKGDDVQARIDDLTDHIREMISDGLLKEASLDLAWRPGSRPWKHHRSLEDVSCGSYRKIRYYIGIDSGLTTMDRKLYVKVRALNLEEEKWVSGFGQSWEGRPTQTQLAALGREHTDEFLRGLRPLPFSGRQPDLLAAYLAHNLSCLLRQGETDDLMVYVENTSVNTPGTFQTTLDLVEKYLARFREVKVTDASEQANVIVAVEIHPIHQNLYQVWVTARLSQGEKYLPGAETEAYVLVDSQQDTSVAGASPPPKPDMPSQEVGAAPFLISSFELLTPAGRGLCEADAAWLKGIRRVKSHEHLPSGSCLAVELSLSTSANVFLVAQSADGDLTRMFPSDCPALRGIDGRIRPGGSFRFPSLSDPGAGVLVLGGTPGLERIYAIVIKAPDLADRFARRLDALPGFCRSGRTFETAFLAGGSHGPVQRWQSYLDTLSDRYPKIVQWQEIAFWHDPP